VGAALVQTMGVSPGDTLLAMSATQGEGQAYGPGLGKTGNFLLDSGYAFVDLKTVEALAGLTAKGYQVRIKDTWRATEVG
jgi:hypothetical protein